MHRQPEHVMTFLLPEMGTSGSLDGQQRLVVKGRFAPKNFEGILQCYVDDYTICNSCKSSDTILSKENRLFFLRCEKVTMAMQLKLISEMPKGSRGWTCKVIVAEKISPETGLVNTVTYQTPTLIDLEENTIRANINEHHIAPFRDTLKWGKTYLISNADVRDAPPRYRRFEGALQWTILGGCSVIEVDEVHYGLVFSRIKLNSFEELRPVIHEDIPMTTLGMLIDAEPLSPWLSKTGQQYVIRDIVLMNKSETVNLRLWSSYAEYEGEEIADLLPNNSIIIAKNVRVISFRGDIISLKTAK